MLNYPLLLDNARYLHDKFQKKLSATSFPLFRHLAGEERLTDEQICNNAVQIAGMEKTIQTLELMFPELRFGGTGVCQPVTPPSVVVIEKPKEVDSTDDFEQSEASEASIDAEQPMCVSSYVSLKEALELMQVTYPTLKAKVANGHIRTYLESPRKTMYHKGDCESMKLSKGKHINKVSDSISNSA